MVVTYHGSCARSTIATIIAVSTAPLGNSQAFFIARRIAVSTRPAHNGRADEADDGRADPLARRSHHDENRQE